MSPNSTQPQPKLQIHPTPFKPSFLSIPDSPFSPREPITPVSFSQTTKTQNTILTCPAPDPLYDPPASPLQWLWQCHQCRRTYALSVTRRCLEDGHIFCAGTTTVKNWRRGHNQRKVKKHAACGSEFDYEGWKSWGRWKRSGRRCIRRENIYDSDWDSDSDMYSTYSSSSDEESNDSDSNGRNPTKLERLQEKQKKDCWNKCDYPSECRWGRQYGVHTPVTVDFPNIWVDSTPTLVSNETSESILKSENAPAKAKGKMKNAEKTDFWSTLVASATRRKSGPPSSPLASVPEEDERALDSPESARDNYNDVVSRSQSETFISPRQLSSTMTEPTTASLPKVTLKDMIRKASKHCHSSKPAESISPEPISQASPRVAPIAEFHFGFDSREDLSMEEFPLLERVASQDSGYVSSTSTEIEL